MNPTKFVFKVDYGGLGDHLFYSALPRLLKEADPKRLVYLSAQSVFRNPQTFDLVWKHNPYLDGQSSDAPSDIAPECAQATQKVMNRIYERFGFIAETEFLPELYYPLSVAPAFKQDYIDLNYISFIGALAWFDKIAILKNHPNHIVVNPEPWMQQWLRGRQYQFTQSLIEYATLLNSATHFVTVASGGATLAAALRKPSVVYHGFGQHPMFHHGMHEYIQVGGSHVLRRKLAKFLRKRNERRLRQSQTL